MHHQDVVFLGQGHHALEERQVDALGGRVAGEAQHHHLGLRNRLAHGALEFLEEVHARRHAHGADVGAGDDRAVDVDRVAGVGHQHGIATVQGGQHQVRQAFLGADGDDGFGIGIELDRVAALVPVTDGLAQARDALGYQ